MGTERIVDASWGAEDASGMLVEPGVYVIVGTVVDRGRRSAEARAEVLVCSSADPSPECEGGSDGGIDPGVWEISGGGCCGNCAVARPTPRPLLWLGIAMLLGVVYSRIRRR